MNPADDPYVVHRGIYHRLGKQVLEENNNRQDLLSVQQNFASFEAHVVEVIQQTIASFNQFVGGQAQKDQGLYADILATAQRITPDFEWNGFVARNSNMLIDPAAGPRSIDSITFPNQNHKSTQPLIEGTLERKSRNKLALGAGYSSGYYVVTPSGFLHEFKDDDNYRKDPVPEMSIYLPDAVVGGISGDKFNVKGKDLAKGLGSKLSGNSEVAFKAHSPSQAEQWWEIIKMTAGQNAAVSLPPSVPTSPVEARHGGVAPVQTQGITGGETVASPVAASPAVAQEAVESVHYVKKE